MIIIQNTSCIACEKLTLKQLLTSLPLFFQVYEDHHSMMMTAPGRYSINMSS